MDTFLKTWHNSAVTSLGLFWMAFWAFGLGYVISSMIQVFVTRARMRKSKVLFVFAGLSYLWLVGGLIVPLVL